MNECGHCKSEIIIQITILIEGLETHSEHVKGAVCVFSDVGNLIAGFGKLWGTDVSRFHVDGQVVKLLEVTVKYSDCQEITLK